MLRTDCRVELALNSTQDTTNDGVPDFEEKVGITSSAWKR